MKINKVIDEIKKAIKRKKSGLAMPDIIYSNAMTKKKLSTSHIGDKTAAECLDSILYELGFISGEQIMIGSYTDFRDIRGYYIECYKDNKYLFKLSFDYSDSFSKTPKLIITYPNQTIRNEYEIDCELVENKTKINLYLTSFEQKFSSGTKYLRKYSFETAEYIISKGENEFVITVERPYGLENTQEGENYKLDNEAALVDYLLKLEFPIEIEEVYKKIYEISLSENISDYPFIHLCTTRLGMATDTLDIEEGDWKTFRKTKGDKTIVIYQSGTWEYELRNNDNPENKTTIFSMNSKKNGVNLTINAKTDRELDEYTKKILTSDISTAISETENVRKLILQMTHQKDRNQL